jgi:hypothetical protein
VLPFPLPIIISHPIHSLWFGLVICYWSYPAQPFLVPAPAILHVRHIVAGPCQAVP